MPQRIDAGPVVAALGAVLLFLSLFLSWYEPDASGWDAFESLDLILAGVAVAAGVLAAGRLGAAVAQDADPRTLPLLGVIAVAAVGVTLLQEPPAAEGAERATGAWLALAASVLVLAGGALSAARISVTVTVAGRDALRRVPAVDKRHSDETTAVERERERTQSLEVDDLLAADREDAPPDKPPPR
jgi:hypothetical protein